MDFKSKQMKSAIFLIAFAITLMWLLDNISGVRDVIVKLFMIVFPFILGATIAFTVNIPMSFIESTFFGKRSFLKGIGKGLKRVLSYLITIVIIIMTIIIILTLIIPELVNTISDLAVKIPSYWKYMESFATKKLMDYPQIVEWLSNINIDWENVEQNVIFSIKNSVFHWVSNTFSFASSVVGKIISFVLAFIFSIYILFQKEVLTIQFKKLILAFFTEKIANKIFYVSSLSQKVFSSFISGQLLESLIVGGMFLVAMTIFKFPYALLISLLIAVTALVPMVGGFVGCILGAFLILVDNPMKAFWFIIMFLILQQIEGNLIYPHVVGKASGLPSIWILVAITVGGSTMGVIGILLFIPVASILYTLLSEAVNNRLKQKKIHKIQ